ncbi:transcriptional regulator [Oceanicola sp. 22II-s10i]|uniref:LysR family transcriptional regulator n=1 Tax=Oceanicola sp. 22II-s10i TaxID=1317116 RepID=UPI000B522FA0|nr:LysR family transcriptional regulator [Oceanicola sp. 22II-s10i]OWU84518.1 transcriptional regulator [Oceanicola sp. 22II-s10i]
MDKVRAMELLVAAAETGSFSAAGRRFNLSPASVSRHISDLEAHLGVTLIHRSTRSLALAEAGQTFVARAEAILESIRAAEADAASLQDVPRGVLRVHSRTMFGISVLAKLQADFHRAFPEVSVELHLSERPARLREDGFDLDFRISPPQESGLMRRRLLASRRLMIAAPDYLRNAPPLTRPSDLKGHACLPYVLGHDVVYWRFNRGSETEEIAIPAAFASNNGHVLLEAVRRGHGIALLDEYTVAADINAGNLIHLMPEFSVTNATFEEGIFATYLETVQMPIKLRVYLDFVAQNWRRYTGLADNVAARH